MGDTDEYSLHESKEYRGPEHGSQPNYANQHNTTAKQQSTMSILLRETDHNADIHIKEVWETDFDKKVGVVSKKEYADIFSEELDWNEHHQKWDTERTGGTDMWEIDLSSVMYVAVLFADRGVDITIDDEVFNAYTRECM